MRSFTYILSSIFTLSMLLLPLSSCKDKDEPVVKAKLSFAESTITVNEDDDVIEIEVTLDKPAGEDFQIEYEVDGSAEESDDYDIREDLNDYGEIDIEKGETSGIIEIQLYSDIYLEENENLKLRITSTDSDLIEANWDNQTEIIIEQEDGLVIALDWSGPSEDLDSLADMDLILRYGQNITTWTGILNASYEPSFFGPEYIFIPKVVNSPAYGLSCTYYNGTMNKLDFEVTYIDFVNGNFESESSQQVFQGTYTLANKNTWTDISTTKVVQTFQKSGNSFTTPTAITEPASGSRIISSDNFTAPTLNKGTVNTRLKEQARVIQKLLKR